LLASFYKLIRRAGTAKDIDRNQYVTAHGYQLSAVVNDVSNEVVGSGAFGVKGELAGHYNTVFVKLDGQLVPVYTDDDEDKVQKGEGVREYKPLGKYRVRPNPKALKLCLVVLAEVIDPMNVCQACWTADNQPTSVGTYTRSWPEDSFDFPQPSPEADGSVNMFISYVRSLFGQRSSE
jgi:hypothetical protein